jgi:hypothetical protein
MQALDRVPRCEPKGVSVPVLRLAAVVEAAVRGPPEAGEDIATDVAASNGGNPCCEGAGAL